MLELELELELVLVLVLELDGVAVDGGGAACGQLVSLRSALASFIAL